MMTAKQIIMELVKEKIPINAVIAVPENSKRLSWGGDRILETTFGDKIEWYVEKIKPNEYMQNKGLFERIPDIQFYLYNHGYDGSYGASEGNKIKLVCNDELKTALELCGGIRNYLEMERGKYEN